MIKIPRNIINCECGCGIQIEDRDSEGRPRKFISGHNRRKYKDPGQHKREWNHRNRPARAKAKLSRHKKIKQNLIALKNNKCYDCLLEYNGKNAAVFHFHHRDPKTKLFNIGNQLTNKRLALILEEVNKCDLLCSNCHELKHSGEF